MKLAAGVAMVICGVASSQARSDERPAAPQQLAAYEKTIEAMAHCKVEVVTKGFRKGDDDQRFKDNKDGFVGTNEWTICRNDTRWRVSQRSHTLMTRQGKPVEVKTGTEKLVGDEAVFVSALLASVEGTAEGLRMSAYLDARAGEKRVHGALGHLDLLFGFVPGDRGQSLGIVMRAATQLEAAADVELVGGEETVVVKSRGRYGTHTLWLDPKLGHLPRRVEVVKQSGDNLDERQLGVEVSQAVAPPGAARRPVPVPPTPRESRVRYENIQIERREGIPVITAFDCLSTTTFDKGKTVENRLECRVRAIHVHVTTWTAADFQPSLSIPDGTPVVVMDAPAGERGGYVWKEGRLQKSPAP